MIGTTLGHYRILAKLGQGGMGTVFEAEDQKLKRRVALKLLDPEAIGGAEGEERLRREAEAIAALNHPNIVTLHSIETVDGQQFLTMERVEGEGLDQLLGRSALTLDRLFAIAIPIADALSAAHARDIIHRDLKPANVMITPEGRVKVLDFGLAKLVGDSGAEEEATAALTQDGMVLGTVPYMSPEQVQGQAVDRRTDIFSLGVMLYEMATGSRPFSGDNTATLISSILRDQPKPVTEVDSELPHHLGRIVRHCLEKEPARRYQSALDVRNELEDLKREVESGVLAPETSSIPAARKGRAPRKFVLAGLAALLTLVIVLVARLAPREADDSRPEVTAAQPSAPGVSSVAVLFFDNLSGDPDLEWLRGGLADMLVTDLSQSPDLQVLSTDRVFQILSDLGKLDERITSFEVVREVAERGGADTVILGSYAKLGDTIQISVRIQEPASGEILETGSVRAVGQDEIFARVDDLSRTIRRSIELPEPTADGDRSLAEVTTSSVEAYRYFVEAERLHYESKEQEAIELYKKAVELDPQFALAWAKLGTTHSNIRRFDEAMRYTEKALEHVDRLTGPERAYVEGRYYGSRLETTARAIDIYREALADYPHLTALANNLGGIYSSLWMYEEAIAAYRQCIAHGDIFPGTYGSLAASYLAIGEGERAVDVLEDFLADHPDSFSAYSSLAQVQLARGRLDAAAAALDRVDQLRPGDFGNIFGRFMYALTVGDLEAADSRIETLESIGAPFARSAALGFRITLALYEGRSQRAFELGEQAVDAWPGPGAGRAQTRLGLATGYLQTGSFERALAHLQEARTDDPGGVIDVVAHGLEAVALQALGRGDDARRTYDAFRQRSTTVPGPLFRNLEIEIEGYLARIRGDLETAIERMEAAVALLPEHSDTAPRQLFELADAYQERGRNEEAAELYRRVISSGRERLFSPYEYVLSHYRLGVLHEAKGEAERARELYSSFVDYWGDGDIEREAVADARQRLAEI